MCLSKGWPDTIDIKARKLLQRKGAATGRMHTNCQILFKNKNKTTHTTKTNKQNPTNSSRATSLQVYRDRFNLTAKKKQNNKQTQNKSNNQKTPTNKVFIPRKKYREKDKGFS